MGTYFRNRKSLKLIENGLLPPEKHKCYACVLGVRDSRIRNLGIERLGRFSDNDFTHMTKHNVNTISVVSPRFSVRLYLYHFGPVSPFVPKLWHFHNSCT